MECKCDDYLKSAIVVAPCPIHRWIPDEVQKMVDLAADESVSAERIRFAPQATTNRGDAWRQCQLPYNPWRKVHTQNYWAWYSTEEVDTKDTLRWVEQQIKVVESDSRFKAEPASMHVNAPLAFIQVSLKTRLQVLQQVRILLKEGGQ